MKLIDALKIFVTLLAAILIGLHLYEIWREDGLLSVVSWCVTLVILFVIVFLIKRHRA